MFFMGNSLSRMRCCANGQLTKLLFLKWWQRRDALVRCAAAFLFGPGSATASSSNSRELVLLFDEDLSRIHMTFQPSSSGSIVPSERLLLALWKTAVEHKGEKVEMEGLSCRLMTTATRLLLSCINTSSTMDNKRELLMLLQKECPLEFLRSHGLNSSINGVLKKTNKKYLTQVWKEWQLTSSTEASSNKNSESSNNLESVLVQLLLPDSSTIHQVIAVSLHESCLNDISHGTHSSQPFPNTQICIFLGAVRDMLPSENRSLELAANYSSVPLIGLRIGPVAEFTSKILTVLAFHQSSMRMGSAIQTMVSKSVGARGGERKNEAPSDISFAQVDHPIPLLHFVCQIPIDSSQVSSSLENRDRHLWCLVRCTVNCLWRSRLIGQTSRNPLINVLTLVFRDGVYVTLRQDDLVVSMAEKHEAAPTEFQILRSLCQKLEGSCAESQLDWMVHSQDIVRSLLQTQAQRPHWIVNVESEGGEIDFAHSFYENQETYDSKSNGHAGLVFLAFQSNEPEMIERKVSFLKSCSNLNIPMLSVNVVSGPFVDWEASCITLLQHFSYQGRLFSVLESMRQTEPDQQLRRTQKRKR